MCGGVAGKKNMLTVRGEKIVEVQLEFSLKS